MRSCETSLVTVPMLRRSLKLKSMGACRNSLPDVPDCDKSTVQPKSLGASFLGAGKKHGLGDQPGSSNTVGVAAHAGGAADGGSFRCA